jgi:hypothetical protein
VNAPVSAIALGLCQCGCGARTRIATHNDKSKGWVKGQPLKFVRFHSAASTAAVKTARSIGNRQTTSHGYVRVMVSKGKRPYEHVVVAERALGRPLKNLGRGHPDTEVVHHIDGCKTNNAPSNLLICTHRYHTELHHRLEQSTAWPEFKKIDRPGFGASRKQS